jgi:hypothetical protein
MRDPAYGPAGGPVGDGFDEMRREHYGSLTSEPKADTSATHFADGPLSWWLTPIRGPLARAHETADKPLGSLTVPELFDWGVVLGYGALTGYVLGTMAVNLAAVLLGGRRAFIR